MSEIKLTQYSHGAGCGCKISPDILSGILTSKQEIPKTEKLLVGNENKDDAAVYDMGDGTAIISTTDFFMPIVDDPFIFGKIAATNAISDVYAMGGQPLFAIAILGWPITKLSPETAKQVLEGGRQACKEAGITIAGGHSIDNPEPVFGLAVTGKVNIKNLKQNNTATKGCKLYLTKPLGTGILTTAQKRGILKNEHATIAPETMMKLNKTGITLAKIKGVKALTDVTGFGLLGHLSEICEGSKLSAIIEFSKIPKFDILDEYISQKSMPGGTFSNWRSYKNNIDLKHDEYKYILCDPQTSGGLLIAVEENSTGEVESVLKADNMYARSFGYLTERGDKLITVK